MEIINKFDLKQTIENKDHTYEVYEFFISNDIEGTNYLNANMLINTLREGIIFNNQDLNKAILATNNKNIIKHVYKHID